jgi:hypothetical protein
MRCIYIPFGICIKLSYISAHATLKEKQFCQVGSKIKIYFGGVSEEPLSRVISTRQINSAFNLFIGLLRMNLLFKEYTLKENH